MSNLLFIFIFILSHGILMYAFSCICLKPLKKGKGEGNLYSYSLYSLDNLSLIGEFDSV